jgi:hypothetical protein
MSELVEALRQVGLLPGAALGRAVRLAPDHSGDLLPPLLDFLASGVQAGDESRRRGAMLLRLRAEQLRGARLTWGIPGDPAAKRWLGPRLAWWPRGIPAGRRIGLVSSRLGQQPERHKSWFAVLRAVCTRLDPARELLVTAAETATQPFVQRCGELFGLPVLVIDVDRHEAISPQQWGERIWTVNAHESAAFRLHLSPLLGQDQASRSEPAASDLPAPDRAVAVISDRLVVLHARSRGKTERIVAQRLCDPAFPQASVYLALGEDLVPPELARGWMSRGAVGWLVLNTLGHASEALAPWTPPGSPAENPSPLVPLPSVANWEYLTHCTRRRKGPWPDEDERQFLDDLILDRDGADHSAFAALWRIVSTRWLRASSALVRGGTPVVSFTAVPLAELPRLHAFRAHLGRWDFEPYGICIRREWLTQHGAQAVRYGDETVWQRLAPEDRPFFQLACSRTARGHLLDWTAEQEWRRVSDLPLADLPADRALLFVPMETEAIQLARISPWPIAVAKSSHS